MTSADVGKDTERMVAGWLRTNGWPGCERRVKTGYRVPGREDPDQGDLTGCPASRGKLNPFGPRRAWNRPCPPGSHRPNSNASHPARTWGSWWSAGGAPPTSAAGGRSPPPGNCSPCSAGSPPTSATTSAGSSPSAWTWPPCPHCSTRPARGWRPARDAACPRPALGHLPLPPWGGRRVIPDDALRRAQRTLHPRLQRPAPPPHPPGTRRYWQLVDRTTAEILGPALAMWDEMVEEITDEIAYTLEEEASS
jgi:hypothetical protein